jgi:hypothetical protein
VPPALPRNGVCRTLPEVIDARRALVSQIVGREVLIRAARALAPAGIVPVVLKGVWLQACIYAEHEFRVITDVDLLVSERDFERAITALMRAGWRRQSGNASELSLAHPELHLPIDLHRRLFTRGAFRLSTDAVVERSRVDHAAFGASVRTMDPRDALAHLIGHFVKSRMRTDDPDRLRDFVAIARRQPFEPVDGARHLHAVGMARAARYVLDDLARAQRDGFYRELLEALPSDRMAKPIVKLSRAIAISGSASGVVGAMPGFLLDRSLPAGARALVLRALDLRHDTRFSEQGAPQSR